MIAGVDEEVGQNLSVKPIKEGTCPVCHQDRARRGCRVWWTIEIKQSGGRKFPEQTLFMICNGFDDIDKAAAAGERYRKGTPAE